MADIQSNIDINVSTGTALANIRSLQREISAFHTSMARGGAAANVQSAQMQQNLLNTVNATGKFRASIQNISTTTETFTNALEKNKLSMAESFRFAGAASGKFGQRFSAEMSTIDKVARERVKSVQTQFIKLGRDANGSLRGIAVRPLALDMDMLATRTAIAAQKQQLFNKLVNQGSTNLLNFGKNTQWTGRQLMVGFTIPLGIFGATASKVFMDLEKQAIAFKKVYGDLFTIESEKNKALKDVEEIAKSMTTYGVAIKDTMGLAAEAAAAGFQDAQLMAQTEQATRLGILGQIDSQKALETTIALQSAFQISTEDLADSINFLNAVENQTVLSLDDVTTAIPKVAPVIQQLGGDVKDLAFFLSAMKEGGINASEGANALKSGLASMINPTKQSSEMLAQMGIDINGIVNSNQGDLKSTVIGFAEALDTLDPLNRAKAIEQLFGKFQFARISALFSNVIRDGSQASRVLDLAGTSLEELSSLADSELGIVADATSTKFMAAMENIKFAIAPIGEEFLKLVTPILTFGTEVLTAFNSLDAGMRQFVIGTIGVLGGIAPIAIMVFGLLANGVATSIKAFMFLRNLFLKTGGSSQILGQQTEYMTQQQLEAAAVAASLGQTHSQLTQIFTAEAGAVTALAAAYNSATAAQRAFSGPVMGSTLGRGPKVPGFNKGKMAGYNKGIVMVPGSGNKDTEPAMLTPGEAVIPADMAKKYGSLINAMISGNIPGFNAGTAGAASGAGGQASTNARSTKVVAQRLASELADGERVVGLAFARLSEVVGVTVREFRQSLAIVLQSEGATESQAMKKAGLPTDKYSADLGPLRDQLVSERGSIGAQEFDREAQVVADGLERLKPKLQALGFTAEQIEETLSSPSFSQVDRAHVVQAGKVAKSSSASWMTDGVIAGTAAENQFSNILASSPKTREQYAKYLSGLSDTEASEKQKAVILDKITRNIQLTAEEQAVQAKVIQKMLDDTSITASGSTKVSKSAVKYAAATQAMHESRAALPAPAPGVGSRSPQEVATAQARINALTSPTSNPQEVSGAINDSRATTLTAKAAKKAARDLLRVADESLAAGMASASDSRSPSRKAQAAGEDIAKGSLIGLNSQKDEMLAAGTSLGEAAVKGSRRAIQGADGTTQRLVNGVSVLPQGTQSATTVARTPGRRASSPTQTVGSSVIPPGHFEKIIAGNQAAADSQQKASIAQAAASQNFSSKIMGLSFGITSIAGVMSMFGGEMAQVSSIIFQVSGAVTGLLFAFQALPATMTKKITELFSTRRAAFAEARSSTQVVPVGGVGGAGAKGGVASGAARAGGALAGLGRGILAFLGGPFGLAITAFLLLAGVAIPALIGIIQEETKKRQALANASDFTTSSLKSLAERVGGTFTGSMIQNASMAGVTDKDKAEAKTLSEDASFLEEFKTQIEGFKNLEGESLTFAIENLTKSLLAGGTSPEAINSILNGLLTASGQSNTQFGMAGISAVQAQGPQNFSSMIAEQEMTISSGRGMVLGNEEEVINTTAMAVNALGAAFATGQVSATGFEEEMEKIKEVIGNIPIEELQKDFILFGGTDAMDGIVDSLDIQDTSVRNGIKGLKNYEDQLLVIEALSQGAAVDPEVFDLLASGDPEDQARAQDLLAEGIRNSTRAKEEATVAEQALAEATASNLEITAGQEAIDAQILALNDEAGAYALLTQNGFSAADAISLVSDAQFNSVLVAAAAQAAADGHSQALDGLLASANALLALRGASQVRKEAVATRSSSGRGGGGGGGKSGPEASGLDKILEDMARVVSVQTTMTKGFAASRTALDRMFGGSNSSGLFGGLEQQMRALGGGEDLIKLIAGMPPEEFNKRKKELFTFDGAGNISSFRDSLVSIGEALRKIALGEFQSKQQATVKSFNDQMVAVNRLVGAGASYADAYEIAGDAALAAAIANETNSAAIRQLVRDTKAAEKATKDFAAAQSVAASNSSFVDQQKLLTKLQQNSLGLSNAQIQAVLDDTDLQRLFMDPSIDAKTLQDALNSVASRAALELEIKKLTIDGLESIFDEGFSKAMEAFDAQEKKIELEFDVKTKPFEDAIRDAEERISEITMGVGGIDDLEADLERISEQEEEINKKYDERAKALSLVKDLNAQMSQQQKTQLSLADALSQGDIGAAARAAQEMRAQQQSKSLDVQEKALDRARELELGAIVGNMGQTREQTEKRIKELKAEIREIEELTLEPAQRRIDLLNAEELKLKDSVLVLGKTRGEWETIKNKIDIAKTSSDSYTKAIEAALGVVTDIVQYWDELDGKQVNTAHIVTTTYKTVGTPPSGTVPSAPSGGGGGGGGGGGSDFDPNKAARDAAEAASKAARARVQAALNNRAFASIVSGRLATMAKATTGTADNRARIIESFLSKITSGQADSLLANLVTKRTPTRTFMYAGGPVLSSMASGGLASMFGSMGTDSVSATLTPGEFVVRRPAVQNFGVDKLEAINNGTYGGESVYNYGININVRSESDPNQIARTVMGTIKSVDAQRIRGNRLG